MTAKTRQLTILPERNIAVIKLWKRGMSFLSANAVTYTNRARKFTPKQDPPITVEQIMKIEIKTGLQTDESFIPALAQDIGRI